MLYYNLISIVDNLILINKGVLDALGELRNNKKKEGKEMNMKLAIIGLFFIVIGFLLGFWFYGHDKGPTVYRIYEISLERSE